MGNCKSKSKKQRNNDQQQEPLKINTTNDCCNFPELNSELPRTSDEISPPPTAKTVQIIKTSQKQPKTVYENVSNIENIPAIKNRPGKFEEFEKREEERRKRDKYINPEIPINLDTGFRGRKSTQRASKFENDDSD